MFIRVVLLACVLLGVGCAPYPALSSGSIPPTTEAVLLPEYGATPGGVWPTAAPGEPGYLDQSQLPVVPQESLPICDFDNPPAGPTAVAGVSSLYAAPTCRPAGDGVNTAP